MRTRRSFITTAGTAGVVALAGCSGSDSGGGGNGSGNGNDTSNGQGGTPGTTSGADPSKPDGSLETVGVSNVSGAGAWVTAEREGGEFYCEMQDSFSCNEFLYQRQQEDISAQVDAVRQMINQDVDGIVIIPWGDALIDVIEEATNEHGIPVFTVDADVESDAIKTNTGFGQEEAGTQSGELMIQNLEEAKPDKDTYEILHVRGPFMGIANARTESFNSVISSHDKAEIVSTVESEWSRETAQQNVQSWIQSNGKPDGIYSTNLSSGLGTLGALERLDMKAKKNSDGHVELVQIDGSPETNEAIANGYIDAAIDQPNYFYVPLAMKQLELWYANGGDDALFEVGQEVTTDDISIPTGQFKGVDLWSEPIWAPGEMVSSNQHRKLQTQSIVINQDNADAPYLYGNIWGQD